MESRNISLTLEKAKEWYNSGNTALKEAALQAYTEEELTIPAWKNIKTFEDAKKALGIDNIDISTWIDGLGDASFHYHILAINKLDIIRKALNGDWKPSLVKDKVYWPYVRFYPAGDESIKAARSNGQKVCQTFTSDNKNYSLVGGGYSSYCDVGLGNFGHGYGDASIALGLLGCKSK